jgi:HAD superfamily hydrolase (TIGR01509 family)
MQPDIRPLLAGKRTLIFDYDQTLVDSAGIHDKAFRAVLEPFDIVFDYAAIAGLTTKDAIEELLERAGISVSPKGLERLVARKRRIALELAARELGPMPGALELVQWASGRFRLAIFSSGSASAIRNGLAAFALDDAFDPVVSAESVRRPKPDPEGLEIICRETGTPPAEALLFDDSPLGLAAARAMGMDAIDVASMPLDRIDYR